MRGPKVEGEYRKLEMVGVGRIHTVVGKPWFGKSQFKDLTVIENRNVCLISEESVVSKQSNPIIPMFPM